MKKKVFLFLVLFFQIFVFGQISDSLYRNMVEVQRGYYKKSCSKDSLRALQDSKVQYKYYMNVAAPYGTEFLPHKELEAILKRNNIEWGGFWMGSDIGGYNEDCYFSYMSKLTENKYCNAAKFVATILMVAGLRYSTSCFFFASSRNRMPVTKLIMKKLLPKVPFRLRSPFFYDVYNTQDLQ